MQETGSGSAIGKLASSPQPTSAAATISKGAQSDGKADKSIKGPALASRSHTLQILIMLLLNSFLLLMCLYVLPAHLLWRRATKQHSLVTKGDPMQQEDSKAALSNLAFDAVVEATAHSTSATRNILTAFQVLFNVPMTDTTAVAWIQRSFRSTLAAVVLSQGWFVARYKGWWDEAEAMERGDREEVLKRRRIGIAKQMENVTLTTFALPLPTIAIYLALVLCGAPIVEKPLDSLILSFYLSVLIFLPAFTLLGTDESEWIKAFSISSSIPTSKDHPNPRFKLLATQTLCTFLGALIGSAGHLLDWEKAWQVYPVPPILGSCIGLVIGNSLGFLSYYRAMPSSSPRVERRANSSTSNTKSKKKKKR